MENINGHVIDRFKGVPMIPQNAHFLKGCEKHFGIEIPIEMIIGVVTSGAMDGGALVVDFGVDEKCLRLMTFTGDEREFVVTTFERGTDSFSEVKFFESYKKACRYFGFEYTPIITQKSIRRAFAQYRDFTFEDANQEGQPSEFVPPDLEREMPNPGNVTEGSVLKSAQDHFSNDTHTSFVGQVAYNGAYSQEREDEYAKALEKYARRNRDRKDDYAIVSDSAQLHFYPKDRVDAFVDTENKLGSLTLMHQLQVGIIDREDFEEKYGVELKGGNQTKTSKL